MEPNQDHPDKLYCGDPGHSCHNDWQYHATFTVNHNDVPWQQTSQQDITLAIEILGDHTYDWQVAA